MQKTLSIRAMAQVGVCTAVLAVLSQISIPLPSGVPITLQTLAVALCGFVLGAKRGALSVALYILLGGIGLPVFAQLSGGFDKLIGMTGGFIWGFLPFAALCGLGEQRRERRFVLKAVLSMAGLAVCHLLGVLQFSLVTGTGFGQSFALVSLPYLVKDVASVYAAWLLALPINGALEKAGLR